MRRLFIVIPLCLAGLLLAPLESWAQRGRTSRSGKAKVGKQAPDFALPVLQGFKQIKKKKGQKHRMIKLSELARDRPVALIFGSYTWPPFTRSVPTLEKLYRRYGKKVQFLVVYIREAHPTDGPRPSRRGPKVTQPTTLTERFSVAKSCAAGLKITMPIAVDQVGGKNVDTDYAALPDRLALVDKGGKLLYYGDRGPWGFKPNDLESAIKRCLTDLAKREKADKQKRIGSALDEALEEDKK